mgnify:CR=1 FL=1
MPMGKLMKFINRGRMLMNDTKLKDRFVNDILSLKKQEDITVFEAISHWCEKNKVEIEYGAALAIRNEVIYDMTCREAENLFIIKRTANSLPI